MCLKHIIQHLLWARHFQVESGLLSQGLALYSFSLSFSPQPPPICPLCWLFPLSLEIAYIFPVIKRNVLNPMTFTSYFLRKHFRKRVCVHCCSPLSSPHSPSLKHHILSLPIFLWSCSHSLNIHKLPGQDQMRVPQGCPSLPQWPLLSGRVTRLGGVI